MSAVRVGCYVMHKKLSDLGSGEVVMVDKGAIRIRFASGERSFLESYVGSHLEVTAEAPAVGGPRAGKRAPRRRGGKKRVAPGRTRGAAADQGSDD